MFIARVLLWLPLSYGATELPPSEGGTTQAPVTPSDLIIFPSSFLPGVTRTVQLTCRPPVNGQGDRLLLLQLDKMESGTRVPVATMLAGNAPVLESTGHRLHATADGHYDSNPLSSYLRVDIPEPTEAVVGNYLCLVETVDSHGLLYRYMDTRQLSSLGRGGAVPTFYETLLKELKTDIDNVTSEFGHVSDTFHALTNVWGAATQAQLGKVESEDSRVTGLVTDVSTTLADLTQRLHFMQTETDRLRDITPETKVNFYAYFSGTSTAPADRHPMVFNVLDQHTDSSYSTSTGIFTCPQNGTYFFQARLSASGQRLYASIQAGDQIVSSAFAFDDYNIHGATADAVVELREGDQVSVLQNSGANYNIYGYSTGFGSVNHVSYFMGMLLW